MNISVGVFARNEEKFIRANLRSIISQELNEIKIDEIIVFSDSSTDRTNDIVNSLKRKDSRIKLIVNKKRLGKPESINKFLKIAKNKIVVISSADVILEEHCIENLCKPLEKREIGICASHIIAKPRKDIVSKIYELEFKLHHEISKIEPKFGEVIAFKKVFNKLDKTSTDEEDIAKIITKKGYKKYYCQNAIVYNFSPKTIKDFIEQRRRIFCGHLELLTKYNYDVPTLNPIEIIKISLRKLNEINIIILLFAVFIEAFSRFLGFIDFATNKEKHYLWKGIRK